MKKQKSSGLVLSLLVSLFLHTLIIFNEASSSDDEQVMLTSARDSQEQVFLLKLSLSKNSHQNSYLLKKKKSIVSKRIKKSVEKILSEEIESLVKEGKNSDDSKNRAVIKKESTFSKSVKSEVDEKSTDEYLLELRRLIDRNKSYPKMARRLKQHGVVIISIKIDRNGKFKKIAFSEKSSSSVLNNAALSLVKKISQFKPLPERYAHITEFKVPISYVIN